MDKRTLTRIAHCSLKYKFTKCLCYGAPSMSQWYGMVEIKKKDVSPP